VWDEISFVKAAETEVEKSNRTYVWEKDRIRQRLILMRNKMKKMYDYQYPIARRVMEDRLAFLEREYNKFDYMINPYHIQPGLLLDVDITSIKRKKATLDAMANVLNEFLHGVSKGFQDAAFASFSRRRSTVREDINQSFADTIPADSSRPAESGSQAYLDLLNAGVDTVEEPPEPAVPVKAVPAKPKVVAEAKPKKTQKPTPQRGPRKGGLREI
jgi:hypothetical protein